MSKAVRRIFIYEEKGITLKIKCGVVDFSNALPLWNSLYEESSRGEGEFEIIRSSPSKLARLFRNGDIDLGLLPVIEYFRNPGATLIPGLGVCSNQAVWSVRLFLKQPLERVQKVCLDQNSETSAALTRILLSKLFPDRDFIFERLTLNLEEFAQTDHDAALIIGDPALSALRQKKYQSLDLCSEWKKLTGLPFVFAAWLVRPGFEYPAEKLHEVLKQACLKGKQSFQAIAKHCANDSLPARYLEEYLKQAIYYTLGEQEVLGLERFAQEASLLELCECRKLKMF